MNNVSIIILDAFCAMLILIIIIFSYRRKFIISKGFIYFIMFSVALLATLIFDIFTFVFIGQTYPGAYEMHMISLYLYFFGQLVVVSSWSMYIFARYFDFKRQLWGLIISAIIFIGCFIPIIINIFYPILFSVDPATNMYYRASNNYQFIYTACTFLFPLFACIILIINYKKISKKEFYSFLITTLTPIIGVIIQLSINQLLSIIYPMITLGLFVVFFYLAMSELQVDSLTGLYNRKQLIIKISNLLSKKKRKKYLVGLMFDLNEFKKINDTYGHIEGDNALVIASNLFSSVLTKDQFLARYAGDEFIIVFETDDIHTSDELIAEINQSFDSFNASNKKQYQLSFAIGKMIFEKKERITIDSFIENIDINMYKDKLNKTK